MADKKQRVESEVVPEEITQEMLEGKSKEDLIAMILRFNEAKDYLQAMIMELSVGADRNLTLIHEMNAQLKMKDLWIETVIETIGRDKITVPDGMLLYSGEDYVYLRDGEDSTKKADFNEQVKADLAANKKDEPGNSE